MKESATNPSNGDAHNQAQQPPLGRNASAGDSQPSLGARQLSAGQPLFGGLPGANGGARDPPKAGVEAGAPAGAAAPQAPSFQARFGGPVPQPHPRYIDGVPAALHVAGGSVAASGAPAPGRGIMDHLGGAGAPGATRNDAPSAGAAAIAASAAARAPPAPPKPPMGGGGMRELRVEDALLYLDDVKREFGDRPRVYNAFLAIMKNFKSQEVDTPGVIDRVSNLFRGYNNLILGFNKFLPDGYKIRMEDLERADALYASEQAKLKLEEERAEQARRQQMQSAIGAAPSRSPVEGRPAQPSPTAASTQLVEAVQLSASFQSQGASPPGPPATSSPTIAQQQGFPRPKAFSEPARRSPIVADQMDARSPQQQPAGNLGIAAAAAARAAAGHGGRPPMKYPSPPGLQQRSPQAAQPPLMAAQPQRQVSQAAPAQPPQQQHQAVEFDHAISYVTTIKRRFHNEPNTYHSFLEILHTYQKEQRGIKEVLEQVAHLFQDHPDLLKEFTFFLPDAVQEQAKERLHRAAADSEARQAAQMALLERQQQAQRGKSQVQAMDIDGRGGRQKFIDMTGHQMAVAQPGPSARGRKRAHAEANKDAHAPLALPQHPETYVYNSAVERQFFDSAREVLATYTRDGGQAWAEFVKCLDLYAQEVLSRSEMLNLVEPLLGKRNTKLFEEFKRILGASGAQSVSQPSMEDSWHSVPLSEIDFSRCRRCSPSYRALPRDYPAPPCGGRSDEEAKVLNNVWVSLPVGSEESYTFRHMRRNTYEEILFRCEDERFEIDMVIDSNAATLARLEPIAEEIGQLAENELIVPETSSVPTPAPGDQGMGGKRFQYTFDKSILGVIHRNAIARIYGDSGQEMLDLIVKNPTVAIPVVVQRLRQKDEEWRVVRYRLNRHWRELAEHNYYRSLDHRSLTWRTTDKRAISTRTLVSDIKDRAAHDGNEGPAALQARIDKAKEEHGGFYEVTKGASLRKKLDLTILPNPDRRLFTPHLSLMYENNNWAHRDAYRILSFALERGSISPHDKERVHRLWTDFLGPWFNLSINWMLSPAVSFQETSNPISAKDLTRIVSNGEESPVDEDEEESLDEDGAIHARIVTEDVRNQKPNEKDDSPSYIDHHPLPPGTTVSTLYGEGQIIKCRRSDDTYVVKLAFGTAYLRPSAVLCSVLSAEKSAYTAQLREDSRTKLERPDDMLAIGTQSLYLFFRLHQILVRRLGIAKELAYSIKDDGSLINMVEQMPGDDAAALGRRRYDAYLSLVYALLDGASLSGGSEGGKYEDRVRCLLGHGGYELATMDKLISHILKNMQSMANDDTMWNLIQLYRRHLDAGSFKPEAFRQEAAFLSDGEAMYAFQLCPVHKDGGDKSVLHFEYLGVIAESSEEEDVSMAEPVEVPVVKRQKGNK